jgi:hypothetical protein
MVLNARIRPGHRLLERKSPGTGGQRASAPSLDQNSAWLLACCIVFAGIGMGGGLTSQVAAANTIPMKHASKSHASSVAHTNRITSPRRIVPSTKTAP